MRIFENIKKTEYNTAVALGYFDGVHLGHKAVITKCVGTAVQNGCVPCVMTFKKSPSSVLSGKAQQILTDNDKKFSLIGSCGAESIYCIDFNEIKNMPAEQFVYDILYKKLNAKFVFCGYNYHFGSGGQADAQDLIKLCKQYFITAVTCDKVMVDGTAVSSTAIRRCIANGDVELANRMLGYEFGFFTPIVSGNHIGTTISTPTINQPLPKDCTVPKFGVYATRVTIGGKTYIGATNIGTHPTVGECAPVCETHLFDFCDGDLYSQKADTRLCKFIRPEQKFDSIDKLASQISMDKQNILSYFSKNN